MVDKDILEQFKCSGCGTCCRWPGSVLLTEADIRDLARFKGVSEDEFIEKHTRLAPNRIQLALLDQADGSCAYLEGNRCALYEARPEQCRTFPYAWSASGCPELDKLMEKQKNIE